MYVHSNISQDDYLGKPEYALSNNLKYSQVREMPVYGRKEKEKRSPSLNLEYLNIVLTSQCLPLPIERSAHQSTDFKDTVSSFLFVWTNTFLSVSLHCLMRMVILTFPALLKFASPSFHLVSSTTYPLLLPHSFPHLSSSLFCFSLLPSLIPFSLTFSLPVALSLCYLELKTSSLGTSNNTELKGTSEDEVCNFVS